MRQIIKNSLLSVIVDLSKDGETAKVRCTSPEEADGTHYRPKTSSEAVKNRADTLLVEK